MAAIHVQGLEEGEPMPTRMTKADRKRLKELTEANRREQLDVLRAMLHEQVDKALDTLPGGDVTVSQPREFVDIRCEEADCEGCMNLHHKFTGRRTLQIDWYDAALERVVK